MSPVTTVHIADMPARNALRWLSGPREMAAEPALLHADVALAAPLRRCSPIPTVQLRRVGLFAFWRDRDAADRWAAEHVEDPIGGGWHAVLEPLRAFGAWPGLPEDVGRSRSTDHQGPSVVLTLGRVRPTQLLRFLRISKSAERRAVRADGMLWGTALARPPFVATCSLWASTRALAAYAYEAGGGPHPEAIEADRRKAFHERSAFVRFRPVEVTGSLAGRNPLHADHLPGCSGDGVENNGQDAPGTGRTRRDGNSR